MRMETLLNLDGGLLLAIQELHQPWLDPIVSGFTKLGDMGLWWIVLSLGMLCWRPTRKAGALALAALVLGSLCTNVFLKHLVARPRPWLSLPLVPLVAERDPNSFPSGHTCAAFAAAEREGFCGSRVTACLPGGELLLERRGERIRMTGPARTVFEGEIQILGE